MAMRPPSCSASPERWHSTANTVSTMAWPDGDRQFEHVVNLQLVLLNAVLTLPKTQILLLELRSQIEAIPNLSNDPCGKPKNKPSPKSP